MLNEKRKLNLFMSAALIVLIGLLLLFLFSGGNFQLLKSLFMQDLTQDQLRDRLMDFGVRGYVTTAIFSMLQVVCTVLPAEPVQVLAGVTFGFPIALACCAAGVFLGNTVIYLLYHAYGDGIRRYFVRKLHFDFEAVANSSQSTLIIFLLYLLPVIPYGMICFFAASIGVKWRRYIAVTFLGSIPSLCIGVGLGHIAITSHWQVTVSVLVFFAVLCVALVLKRELLFDKINSYAERMVRTQRFKVQPCKRVLFNILFVAVRIYYFLSGVRITLTNKAGRLPESPSIVLCNHGSFFDFLYAGSLLRRCYPHFVIARLYFYHKWLSRLLKWLGGFPKSMFAVDVESVKNSLTVLKEGGVLAMMPEARLSTVGKFEDIQEGTFSFLKKSRVPVYTIKISGDYFAKPKWGKGFRRGSVVEAELELLYSPEDLAALSVDDIQKGVEQRLYYDEFQWLQTRPDIRYRSRHMAEGLENILTVCPICHQRHTITTKGEEIFCRYCGRLTSLDGRYAFTGAFPFENFAQWYDWQKELIEQEIARDPDYVLTSPVELRLPSLDGKSLTRSAGRGVCTLDRNGLTYSGTRDGEPCEVFFPIRRIYRLLFGAGENFEIYNGSEILYFVPDERRCAVDWYMTSMIFYDNAVKKVETI